MASSRVLTEINDFMNQEISKGFDPEDLIMNTINYCVLELSRYQSKEDVFAFLQEQSTLLALSSITQKSPSSRLS